MEIKCGVSSVLAWGFLQSHDLLIGKLGSVMDQAHRALRFALLSRTLVGLVDSTTINLLLHGVLTDHASEESCRNRLRISG